MNAQLKPAVTMPSKAEKGFWSVKEAARYLNVTPMTIYTWINSPSYTKTKPFPNPPPAFKIGPSWRIPIAEFMRWTETFRRS